MAEDKRLDTLQDEIKLLKGEIKNSLASVRDYLLNMELPSSEFSTILAALSGDGNGSQKITLDGNIANSKAAEPEKSDTEGLDEEMQGEAGEEINDEPEQPSEDEDLLDVGEPADELSEEFPEENPVTEEESLDSEDNLLPEDEVEESEDVSTPDAIDEDELMTPESELPAEEEQPMDFDRTTAEVNQSIPKVNMLANLINWVAKAKKEIGYEQMPIFLEVYGTSGHLTPELKEVILHLAEITKERPEAETDADIWSQAMLSLHGILTGGDAPLHPVIPSWEETADEAKLAEEEIIEIDKSKEKPVKLKLVFPNGNGKNKEFCIDLTPDDDNGSS